MSPLVSIHFFSNSQCYSCCQNKLSLSFSPINPSSFLLPAACCRSCSCSPCVSVAAASQPALQDLLLFHCQVLDLLTVLVTQDSTVPAELMDNHEAIKEILRLPVQVGIVIIIMMITTTTGLRTHTIKKEFDLCIYVNLSLHFVLWVFIPLLCV